MGNGGGGNGGANAISMNNNNSTMNQNRNMTKVFGVTPTPVKTKPTTNEKPRVETNQTFQPVKIPSNDVKNNNFDQLSLQLPRKHSMLLRELTIRNALKNSIVGAPKEISVQLQAVMNKIDLSDLQAIATKAAVRKGYNVGEEGTGGGEGNRGQGRRNKSGSLPVDVETPLYNHVCDLHRATKNKTEKKLAL